MNLSKPSLMASALAIGAALWAPAQASPLEAVVVTATRTPEPLAQTGDSISVVTGQMLDDGQATSLGEAIAMTPGTTVLRNGGLGQTTTLSLRGATPGQTLVLIDGVRINDPSTTDGQALLGDLLVNDIDRIEILRGPQSALYGSDAIGGVAEIFTRLGGAAPFAVRASADTGSFDTYKLNAGANGSLGSFDYGGAVQYLHTNGISAADSRAGNSEPDGTHNVSATLNTRYHVADNLSVDLRGYFVRARTQFDDNFDPVTFAVADSPVYSRDTLYTAYAGVNWDVFDGALKNRFAATETDSRRTTFDSPYYLPLIEDYAYRGHARRFEYQGIARLGATSQLTFGAETERTTLASQIGGYADAAGHVTTTGYYAEGLTHLFDQLTLTAGVRLEDNSAFGTHAAYKASAAWTPDNGATVLRANYGTGFKAPTLYEEFSAYSNPIAKLAPETAQGWEAGIDRQFLAGRVLASATYFHRTTKNLIDFYSCFLSANPACGLRPFGYYYNVGRSKGEGMELSLTAQLSETLRASANYTYLQASDEITHTVLARRPHGTASASLFWEALPGWSLGADLLYVGARFDGAGDYNRQPSHTTADLFLSHRLNSHIELYGRVENVFDAQYEPVAGYGAPGRAVYGGVRVSE